MDLADHRLFGVKEAREVPPCHSAAQRLTLVADPAVRGADAAVAADHRVRADTAWPTIKAVAFEVGPMNLAKMPEYRALSVGDRMYVNRCLRRGEAPRNRDSRPPQSSWPRAICAGDASTVGKRSQLPPSAEAAIWFGTAGDPTIAAITAIGALINFATIAVSPMFWPKRVARSLEAARAVVGSGD